MNTVKKTHLHLFRSSHAATYSEICDCRGLYMISSQPLYTRYKTGGSILPNQKRANEVLLSFLCPIPLPTCQVFGNKLLQIKFANNQISKLFTVYSLSPFSSLAASLLADIDALANDCLAESNRPTASSRSRSIFLFSS